MTDNPFAVLGLATDAPPGDVRRAWEAIVATFRREEVAVYSLVESEAERLEFLDQVEDAYRILSDPSKRAAWDNDHNVTTRWKDQTLPPVGGKIVVQEEQIQLPEQPIAMTDSSEVDLNVELYDGAGLERIRIGRGLSRAEVAGILKISRTQVQALEEMDAHRLPAAVYIKGFIRNYARLLHLDADKAIADYMEVFHA